MKPFLFLVLFLGFSSCVCTATARDVREVSIKYLNAAISSLADKSDVRFVGRYGGNLRKTPLWQGYHQFSLGAPDSNATFSFAVCETGGEIFDALLELEPGTLFNVRGFKTKLSGKFYDCIVVTDLQALAELETNEVDVGKLRLTLTHEDGTKEVVRNLRFGDVHDTANLTIQVDLEDATTVD